MPPNIARGNATRARIRSHIEHVFAAQKHPLGLVIRTIGIIRGQRSVSPISPITSPDWLGTTGEQRRHDREVAAKHGQRPPKPVLLSTTTALPTVDDRSPALSHRLFEMRSLGVLSRY